VLSLVCVPADGTVMPILSECGDCNVTYILSEFSWYWMTILVRRFFVRCTKLIQPTFSHPMCFKSILILFSHLHLGFRHIFCLQISQSKNSSAAFVQYDPPISTSLIYSPDTQHKAQGVGCADGVKAMWSPLHISPTIRATFLTI